MHKTTKILSRLTGILALVCLLAPAVFRPARGADTPTVNAATRAKIFDLVWTRVRDRHYDPKMNGLDWDSIRKQYEPKALAAPTDIAFYETLNQMLGELKQSHLGVIPPDAVQESASGKPAAPGEATGDTGITALLIGDQAVITRVAAKSGGADAGLKPGLAIVAIDDKPLAPRLQKLHERRPALREGEERVMVWAMLRGLLTGPGGKTVKITAKGTDDASQQTYTVVRHAPGGEILRFGALPPIPSEFETKRLAGGIGYIRFNIFLIPLLDPVRQAVREMAQAKAPGIIIDLRGNPGGIGLMASGVAGPFLKQPSNLGVMKTRALELQFPIFPQPPHYAGPLVILTDESSLSTSEILAAGLQEIGRATVIGRPSGGMVLPSQVEELPGGGEFQYVFADYHTPKGVRLEGKGVIPDIPVTLTQESLLTHPDPILDAALAALHKEKAAGNRQ